MQTGILMVRMFITDLTLRSNDDYEKLQKLKRLKLSGGIKGYEI